MSTTAQEKGANSQVLLDTSVKMSVQCSIALKKLQLTGTRRRGVEVKREDPRTVIYINLSPTHSVSQTILDSHLERNTPGPENIKDCTVRTLPGCHLVSSLGKGFWGLL